MKINSGTQSFNMINNNLRKDEKKGIEDKFSFSENTNTLDKQFLMKPSFKANMKESVQTGLTYSKPVLAGGVGGLFIAGAGILGRIFAGIPGVAAASVLSGIAAYRAVGGNSGGTDEQLKANIKTGLASTALALGCGTLSSVCMPLAIGTGFVAGAAKFTHDAMKNQ
jgi:hypothetical protein